MTLTKVRAWSTERLRPYLPPALDWCAAPQAISSETGKVIDDFVLKKAAGYKPNPTARNDFLGSGFQSTYQPSFLEVCVSDTRLLVMTLPVQGLSRLEPHRGYNSLAQPRRGLIKRRLDLDV